MLLAVATTPKLGISIELLDLSSESCPLPQFPRVLPTVSGNTSTNLYKPTLIFVASRVGKNCNPTSPFIHLFRTLPAIEMATDVEKASVENVENVPEAEALEHAKESPGPVDVDVDEEYSYEEQRKIIHRVDRRLVLSCGLAYCISLMDRTNVSMASLAG